MEGIYYIKGASRERPGGPPAFPGLAHIASGIRFGAGRGGAALLKQWEALVEALRRVG